MSDVAIYNASVPDRMTYAQALAQSGLLPEAYRGRPANVLVALEYGAALGIPPMVSIQQVHIVQGRPVASAQLIGALVRKAGHRLRVTGDAMRARCEIIRADDPDFTFVAEWTIERARDAKLTSKETWRAYPANMLKARAITECARDACPEALAGVSYTAEELGESEAVDPFPTTVEVVPQADDGAASLAETPSEKGAMAGSIPADSPAPSSDITDAVVVDETTGEVLADRAVDYDERYGGEAKASERSVKRLWALLAEKRPDLKGDSTARLAWTSDVLGRDVESWNDLRQSDATRLGERLEQLQAAS